MNDYLAGIKRAVAAATEATPFHTEDTGGGCLVAWYRHPRTGLVIGLNEECAVVYPADDPTDAGALDAWHFTSWEDDNGVIDHTEAIDAFKLALAY